LVERAVLDDKDRIDFSEIMKREGGRLKASLKLLNEAFTPVCSHLKSEEVVFLKTKDFFQLSIERL
jgi:hypothetical protein